MRMKFYRLLALSVALLTLCSACSLQKPSHSIVTVTYVESVDVGMGTTVQAAYSSEGHVLLTFKDGHTQLLKQAVSASGSRYVAEGVEWWEHQGEVTYKINGQLIFMGQQR
ncbi:membrane-bound inhibitor of C-type lysozyme [Reinekea marinisedimentorum]|uniref:Membrane-bound inhibitor of C-type lysozyme n=1 Tax=Reinekea marinisedimentorum TaxID=230495 RepID=A0A4V2UJM2_9GAMM|nr:membrane-bound inhibitor of C-type lysozyme [Reinekea marinisedimentorum]